MKLIVVCSSLLISRYAFGQSELTLNKAEKHPMQYYLSLPQGWTKDKTWPVVVILESAAKDYKTNAERFVIERGDRPFILVAPINTNNGSQGRRDPNFFPYSSETWDYMEKVGDCQFNDEGISAVVKEVSEKFRGESKVFITGFEAGTHALWSIVFNHPEILKAAVPVAGNFRSRCVEQGRISNDPSKVSLPIHALRGGKVDENVPPATILFAQWKDAKSIAQSNGYKNVSEEVISTKGHEPMPEEVLTYFQGLRK